MKRKLYLIGYDVSHNRRRRKVLLSVKSFSVGGQKSLYECWLSDAELAEKLLAIQGMIDSQEDKVIAIQLDPRASIHMIGIATLPPNGDFFYQG